MTRWKATLAVLVATVSLSVATIASAATQTLTATITGTYSADGLTVNNATAGTFDGQPHIYRVDISTLFVPSSPAVSTESFGASSFDVVLNSHLSRVTTNNANVRANWFANNPAMTVADANTTNVIPFTFTGGDNADLGTSATDLVAITQDVDGSNLGKTIDPVSFASVPDPRQAIGKGSPFKLGSVYVSFDGTATTTLTFANAAYSIANTANSPLFGNAVATQIAPVTFPAVPEPAAIALMGIGGLGLIGAKMRRRSA
jgi:hypothetical protein